MEFLKTLFEAGALTWEQFAEAAKKAGFEVVNASIFSWAAHDGFVFVRNKGGVQCLIWL